ncbi:GlxA family transcriptional regulator [Bacillus sp. NP157]|nr:GlxA family transcriptional regulator [Bacillus sp. NP157]
MHHVAFVVFPGFQIQDLGGPLSAFENASNLSDGERYCCHVVSESGGPVRSSSGLVVLTSAFDIRTFDTVIVTGGDVANEPCAHPALAGHLRRLAAHGMTRIASVCTGAFILAESGLLDGHIATTHWRYALLLQRRFPSLRVRSDEMYVNDRGIWTSAGVSAGIDLSLALIGHDLGPEVARETACQLVFWNHRPGGQSQFSSCAEIEPATVRMRDVMAYVGTHLSEDLSTERLAKIAGLSARQFGRAFLAETGNTPAKAVERLRVEAATPLVEAGHEPIERIAAGVGFVDPERMRRAFIRVTGHPPQSIRRMALNAGTPLRSAV